MIKKIIQQTELILNIFLKTIDNMFNKKDVYYIIENVDWSIKHDGKMITSNLKNISSKLTKTNYGIRNAIVHYGSINTFMVKNKIKLPHKSNKIVVTWFHIAYNDDRIKLIPEAIKYVDIWHTSCMLTKEKMVNLGIPKDKITVIPLGVDLKSFKPVNDKSKIRNELGIPQNKIIIGSFQKDGNGWGEGFEPKLIKGPDIFCDVVEKLARKYDIFILLTGPARGYVKKRLEKAGIPYKHDFLETPNEVVKYFQAIDLYMVTSREEGGPKAILESLASGVPLISTKVGMAPDIIEDGVNGFLVDIEDAINLYKRACHIIENKELQTKFIKNGLKIVKDYDWKEIANQYYKKIYKGLLK